LTVESQKEDFATRQLIGLKVLVTRGRTQSAEITSLLEKAGAEVINCPTIEIREPHSWAALDAAIEKLESYDWIIFTSTNGVEFFYRRLAQRRGEAARLPDKTITCAIGPATAKALETASARVDIVARDSKAEGVLAAIIEQAGGPDNMRGLRFLIPRARIARDVLPVELSALGATVGGPRRLHRSYHSPDGARVRTSRDHSAGCLHGLRSCRIYNRRNS
jgi:uroporphyrinogen III methyltransferase/synthase